MNEPITSISAPVPPQTPTRNVQTPLQEPSSTTSTSTTTTTKEAPALATTKRKFHKLLDGITRSPASSATSTTTTTINTDSSAKRIRLEARSRLAASNSTNTSPTTAFIQSQLLSSRLAAARKSIDSRTGSERKEPNYLPWSQAQFLSRLKTFADVRLWTSKPDAVGEVEWAKRGWVCVDVNTVACKGGCEQRVVVGLREMAVDEEGVEVEGSEDFSVEINDELVKRYVDLIITGHDESCLWRNSGCGDDVYRLQIAQPSIWQPQLRERYHSFLALGDSLPPLSSITSSIDINNISTQLPSTFFDKASSNSNNEANGEHTPHNTTALAFAILGWTGSPDPAVATCGACFRRLGLWLYSPQPAHSSNETQPGRNDEILTDSMKLDLVGNHRDYCPWINAASQRMQGSFSGLTAAEILVRLVRNHAAYQRSIDPQQEAVPPNLPENGTTKEVAQGVTISGSQAEAVTSFEVMVSGTSPKKDRAEIDREDKVRFARLKELKRKLGFGKTKGKAK